MIKVGQIYYSDIWKRNMVVCWRSDDCVRTDFICNDGFVVSERHLCFDEMELIAEYPTWQEAVNSKAFNEVNNE